MKVYLSIIIVFGLLSLTSAQNNDLFTNVENVGKSFTLSLKNGEIGNFKRQNPPKNTWTYSRLLEYKKYLDNKKHVLYGSFIQPSLRKKDVYFYNFYAIRNDGKKDDYHYFFIASIGISIKNNQYTVINSYLFTEDMPLKKWWQSTLYFFESDDIKQIPTKFLRPNICPPPPQNF